MEPTKHFCSSSIRCIPYLVNIERKTSIQDQTKSLYILALLLMTADPMPVKTIQLSINPKNHLLSPYLAIKVKKPRIKTNT